MLVIACSGPPITREKRMADNKITKTGASVTEFLRSIENPQMRADAKKVASIMRRVTGKRAKMWGSSIVGYGTYHYKYDSGREGDFMVTGYSPRKQALTVYVMPGFSKFAPLMKKLGKYKTGKSCLYIKRLSEVNEDVLEQLIDQSVQLMRKTYKTW